MMVWHRELLLTFMDDNNRLHRERMLEEVEEVPVVWWLFCVCLCMFVSAFCVCVCVCVCVRRAHQLYQFQYSCV